MPPPPSNQIGPFDGTWTDTAHHGALPHAAVTAAPAAPSWKISPNRLREDNRRLSPDLYNGGDDIDRAPAALNAQ